MPIGQAKYTLEILSSLLLAGTAYEGGEITAISFDMSRNLAVMHISHGSIPDHPEGAELPMLDVTSMPLMVAIEGSVGGLNHEPSTPNRS